MKIEIHITAETPEEYASAVHALAQGSAPTLKWRMASDIPEGTAGRLRVSDLPLATSGQVSTDDVVRNTVGQAATQVQPPGPTWTAHVVEPTETTEQKGTRRGRPRKEAAAEEPVKKTAPEVAAEEPVVEQAAEPEVTAPEPEEPTITIDLLRNTMQGAIRANPPVNSVKVADILKTVANATALGQIDPAHYPAVLKALENLRDGVA